MLYPLIFEPLFKERIWGGRELERLYHKALPPNTKIGESWEISDRPGDESVIRNGPLAGRTLRWLMEEHAAELLGPGPLPARFPLLIKIIDAQERLSLQVHPPAAVAAQLGGEPKTEMWYVAHAAQDAELFVGLKAGVTRAEFEAKIASQTVAECFHCIPVKAGDAMMLPSGRVHALGAHIVIFEVQQNSDTTYRVFDWNRLDASGKPRELHVPQSLASIDFNDFEPPLCPIKTVRRKLTVTRQLVRDELFQVNLIRLKPLQAMNTPGGAMMILGITEGTVCVGRDLTLKAGQFCLLPASLPPIPLQTETGTAFLQIEPGTK